MLDGVQTGLDIIGLIPGLGEIADGINALIYVARGDYANAALSAASMVPIAGYAATGVKMATIGALVFSRVAKGVSNIAKNAKKMSPDDIGKFLNAGKDWHKGSAKGNFLKQFKKELKGDTNADFYIDNTTREVFLKSNKSGNWINTGQKFD